MTAHSPAENMHKACFKQAQYTIGLIFFQGGQRKFMFIKIFIAFTKTEYVI